MNKYWSVSWKKDYKNDKPTEQKTTKEGKNIDVYPHEIYKIWRLKSTRDHQLERYYENK